MNTEIIKKANELHELAKVFSLSHAVFATGKVIEDGKRQFTSGNDDKFVNYDTMEVQEIDRCMQDIKGKENVTDEKVYVSVGCLEGDSSVTERSRTFYYKRKMLPERSGASLSFSEHFEIILPSKKQEIPIVDYDKDGKLLKRSIRFLVGHELGHLWLHLDEIRRNINEFSGAKFSKDKEEEANAFSFELSRLRDEYRRDVLCKNTIGCSSGT
ncbi:MAG: ImmA/IrrE family metallo-endopeptidase [Chitinispirillales bacterium]|nr:ImmA/IrrE family metallo-endopeptidase [Chitinispirillales bacterium]